MLVVTLNVTLKLATVLFWFVKKNKERLKKKTING